MNAEPPLKYTDFLADTEKTFVAVFRKIGPLVELHKLEEECLRQGMNRTTFWINLSNSPIISRFARCVYGLRGTEISPGLAESLVIERKKNRVLGDYGWTQDGKIFLTYTLSSGALSNGIITVPKGMKQHLSGSYELRVAEGAPIGRLVVKDSQAWELGRFSVGVAVTPVIRCEYFLTSRRKLRLHNRTSFGGISRRGYSIIGVTVWWPLALSGSMTRKLVFTRSPLNPKNFVPGRFGG